MERIPFGESVNKDTQIVLNQILDGAVGDIIELDADVSSTGNQLKVNQLGFNPATTKLFWNLFGITYSLTLTATA